MSTTMSLATTHLAGRAAAALTVLVLSTACSAAATGARPAAAPEPVAAAGGAYDGWAVRLQWRLTTPGSCGFSPDQVERLLEADAPLPPCLSRLQRWFAKDYPASR